MRKTDNFEAWSLLSACRKTGGLAKAAAAESLDLSVASRLIAGLETELGVGILDRRVRPAVLTETGTRLAVFAQKMVKARRDALELASEVHALEAREGEKRTLRLSLPMNLNRVTLISQIMTYEDRHPDVRVEISADSGLPALIAGKTDVSLGSYYRPDPRLFALPAGICYSFIMATKKYERKYGLPETIEDLKHHTILLRYTQNLGYSNKLENGTETYYIDRGHRVQHGDAAACREMLLAGEGLAIDLTPGFVSDSLASGFVFPVLKGWHREPWHYHVYCRAGSQDDKVLRELMAYVERGVFATFANQWQFWYGKLGIPMPEGFVPQSKS